MRSQVEAEGLAGEIDVDSAGTIDFHAGNPPDPRMIQAAEARGIPMKGAARQVRREDLSRFDWILAMDRSNLRELVELEKRSGETPARIALFCEFCEEHDEEEVPDPYYGGPEGFEKVLDLLEDGCASFLRRYREDSLA